MNNKGIFLIFLIGFCILVILFLLYVLSPVSSKSDEVSFVVTKGESLREIAHNLKNNDLIKSDKFFLGYAVIKDAKKIYAA